MTMTPRTLAILLVALTLVAGARPALAQDTAGAELAFTQGRDLLAAGAIVDACDKFAESQRLAPAVGTLLNLADCRERLGRLASAWADFRRAAAHAARDGQPRREAEANRRTKLLEPRLTRVIVRVRGDRPDDLVISRDGRQMNWLVGVSFPIDAGTHRFEANAPGHVGWFKEVTVAGEGATVVVDIPPLAEAAAPRPSGKAALRASTRPTLTGEFGSRRGLPPRRIAALGTAGAGLVVAGIGIALRVQAGSRLNEARALCGPDLACGSAAERDQATALTDSAQHRGNFGLGLLATGATAIAGGIALWVTASDTSRPMSVQAQVGTHGLGLIAIGRF